MARLLALISNPDNAYKLRGDREVKEIINCLKVASPISFSYEIANQVRVEELPTLIKNFNASLIHFTGHGSEKKELLFENLKGQKIPISNSTIDIIFKSTGKNINCVLFSACYSGAQAKIVAKYVQYAIGFPDKIEEELASLFSRTFYEYLANNISIEESFEISKSLIEGLVENKNAVPVLYKNPSAINRTLFEPPELLAKFSKEKAVIKENENGNFDITISVSPVPEGVTAITYEIIEDDYPDAEKCTQVTNLESGCSTTIESYGDLLLRVWLWSETKETGIGFKSTLFSAMEAHYGANPPQNIARAIKQMIKNDQE